MKNYFFLFFLTLVYSCKDKEPLYLEIVNKQINAYPFLSSSYQNSIEQKAFNNIITYKLVNNSSQGYYFNVPNDTKLLKTSSVIAVSGGFLIIKDMSQKEISFSYRNYTNDSPENDAFLKNFELITKKLNYKSGLVRLRSVLYNFYIGPHETVYFEQSLEIPISNTLQPNIYLDSNKQYTTEILICSDSTGIKDKISRVDDMRIKENNYEVYHGVIKSNSIPIKFIK